MKVIVPLAIKGSLNSREHWSARARRVKHERFLVCAHLPRGLPSLPLPLVITLTRVAPRELDDDNLVGRFKGVRDEVAKWLGVDDRNKAITWRYQQRKPEKPKQQWIEIEVAK